MKSIIEKEDDSNELIKSKSILIKAFKSFDYKKDMETLEKLIIKEYTKNTFYGDINKWIMNKMYFYEPVAYFTARLMYALNSYAEKNKMYFNKNKERIYRGIKVPYTSLLPYERAKNKIILLSSFTSTSEKEKVAKKWAGRKNPRGLYEANNKFSVVYYITNIFEEKWISNGVNIQKEEKYKIEKEILYQPFSFYYVNDVKINKSEYTADIYLETIGKTEILEEKIKYGKEIEYNEEKKIIQIKE